MTNNEIVITMLNNYLFNYYDADNIILGYQNNYTPPINNDFVIATNLSIKQAYSPNRYYNATTHEKVLYGYNDTEYQVDLYGKNSFIAVDALYTILKSVVASNYLIQYDAGIGIVHNPKNLTGVNSRQNYMHKYTILFSLLSNTKITIAETGLALTDVTINLKEYT